MRLPRLTTRRLMVVVALAAVGLAGWMAWGRYAYHRDRAATARRVAAGLRRMMDKLPSNRLARGTTLDFEDGGPPVPATPDACRRYLAYLDRIARTHEYAARRPWLPAPPDPPPPE